MKKLTGCKPLNLSENSNKRGIFNSFRNKINHIRYGIASPEVFRSSSRSIRNYVPKKSFGKIFH